MRKLLLITFLIVLSLSTTIQTYASQLNGFKQTDLIPLKKYLAMNAKYPSKAHEQDRQGNSIILFAVADGKIKDLKVTHELGFGTDVEMINLLLNYTAYKSIASGKYALKTLFTLHGSTTVLINETTTIPTGYTEIKITISGVSINAVSNKQNLQGNNSLKLKDVLINGKEPLIIVNGKQLDYELLSIIDPNKIESLDVLKDVDGTHKYGEKGKDGVMIFTMKGQKKSSPELKNDGANKIIIKGNSSNTKNAPLYIVDDEITENISLIDPKTIKEIKVIKQIDALEAYGEKASNGIVQITTKEHAAKSKEFNNKKL